MLNNSSERQTERDRGGREESGREKSELVYHTNRGCDSSLVVNCVL